MVTVSTDTALAARPISVAARILAYLPGLVLGIERGPCVAARVNHARPRTLNGPGWLAISFLTAMIVVPSVMLVGACRTPSGAYPSDKKAMLAPADERLLMQFWYAESPTGTRRALRLILTAPAFLGAGGRQLIPADPEFAYYARGHALAQAHYELLRVPEYGSAFAEAEAAIASALPENPSSNVGHQITFTVLQNLGILDRIIERAGPTSVVIPESELDLYEGSELPVWGAPDEAFIHVSSDFMPASQELETPPAAMPFRCCNGKLVISALSPLEADYRDAHLALYGSSQEYRRKFDGVFEKAHEEVQRISRLSRQDRAKACIDLTRRYRDDLLRAGVLDELEAHVWTAKATSRR